MSYILPYKVARVLQEKDFASHISELLSEVLVSDKRIIDLRYSDSDEILQLIQGGSVEMQED